MNVRRLAAVDMHGPAGTPLRRRLILAEFVAAAIGSLVIGLLMLSRTSAGDWRLAGIWVAGVGINYIALAVHAAVMSRHDVLAAELAGIDVGHELRRYSILQFSIIVPFLVAVLALRQLRR
jgi:hypothetical protein